MRGVGERCSETCPPCRRASLGGQGTATPRRVRAVACGEFRRVGQDRAGVYACLFPPRGAGGSKRQSSAALSLDGALKALSPPKEGAPQAEEARGEPATFEDGVEATTTFVEIRESGAWRESGHATFEEYLRARWGHRGVTCEVIRAGEDVSKDPPRSLRGTPMGATIEICERLKRSRPCPPRTPACPLLSGLCWRSRRRSFTSWQDIRRSPSRAGILASLGSSPPRLKLRVGA